MSDYGVIIEEISGPSPRRLSLEGSALPEGELVERHSRTLSRHLYPGNAEATIQVLATDPKPITIRGLFSNLEVADRQKEYADAMREALRSFYIRARLVRLTYRETVVEGVVSKIEFGERRTDEIRYEMEIDVTRHPKNTVAPLLKVQRIQAEVLRRELDQLSRIYDRFVEEIAAPPPGSLVTQEDIAEFQTIAPVELLLDPWLEWRIQYEELQDRLRALLELAGNEDAINIDDATRFGVRTAWVLANKLRQGIEQWDGTGLGVLDQLTQISLLYEMSKSVDSLRLMLYQKG